MKRKDPCIICGRTEGMMAYSFEPACSEMCRKFSDKEISQEQFELETGRRYNHETKFWDQFSAAKVLEKIRNEKARLQTSR